MARLTRMQKYAERRKEMASENEANLTPSALDSYKNKLDALEANFNNLKKEEEINIEPIVVDDKPKQEDVTPSYEDITKEFNKVEDKKEDDFLSSLDTDNIDKAINELINQKISVLDDIKNEEQVKEDVESFIKAEENKLEENAPVIEQAVEETLKEEPKDEVPFVEVASEKEDEVPALENTENEVVKEEEPVQENIEVNKPEEVVNVIDNDYKDIADTLAKEVEELDGKVEPVKEEEKVLPTQDVKEETLVESKTEVDTSKEVTAPIKEPEVVNYIDEDYATIASRLAKEVEELDGKVEPVKEEEKVLPVQTVKEETPVIEEIKEETLETEVLNDASIEPVSDIDLEPLEEISVDDILGEVNVDNNSYVDETLKEVEEYNKQDGLKTVDDVKDMIVDDIRHNKPSEMDSEEFANTVSLEIDKVLNEIKTETPSIDVSDVTLDNVIEPIDVDMENAADKLADTIEHPVLAQSLEEGEEPVEIKSMEETLTQDVVDDTIPFMMEDVKENTKEYEYEEIDDEKPNKILNVILIVLIVILLIILGVITYYLLYAKGLIG